LSRGRDGDGSVDNSQMKPDRASGDRRRAPARDRRLFFFCGLLLWAIGLWFLGDLVQVLTGRPIYSVPTDYVEVIDLGYSLIFVGLYQLAKKYLFKREHTSTKRERTKNIVLACGVFLWFAGGAVLDHILKAITGQPFGRYIDYMWPVVAAYAFAPLAIFQVVERVTDRVMYRTSAAEWLGKSFRFVARSRMHADITAHSGQTVIARRIVGSKWQPVWMIEIEAPDGWRGEAFPDELVR
jgi:hypothetical protein